MGEIVSEAFGRTEQQTDILQLTSTLPGSFSPTSPAHELLRQIAADLFAESDNIALTMVNAYDAEIPTYHSIVDPWLKRDIHSVSSAMVRGWLHVMSTGEPIEPEVLRFILEGVRRRAVQGIELPPVLQAFRVGIRVMWREITSSSVWSDQHLKDLLAEVATWALDFADHISTAVAAAYLDQSEQLSRERSHSRSALLDVILSGTGSPALDWPAALETRHCVAVARVCDGLSLLDLERTGKLLETKGDAVLWTVRHQSIIAVIAWPVATRRSQLLARLEPLIRYEHIEAIGVGGIAAGPFQTRQSYAEAVSALTLGSKVSPEGTCVFDFQDLAAIAAILEQPERAHRFVEGVLEPLGEFAKKPWVLPTLEAFLSSTGSLKDVARTLGVHINTVKYRLKELRGCTDLVFAGGDRARTLVLALKVRRALVADTTRNSGTSIGFTSVDGTQSREAGNSSNNWIPSATFRKMADTTAGKSDNSDITPTRPTQEGTFRLTEVSLPTQDKELSRQAPF